MAVNKNFVVKNGIEVNDNLIVANASNNRVGVGTSVPSYTLHVQGGIGVSESYVGFAATVAEKLQVGSDALTVLGVTTAVGVGTTNPAYLLDVRSSVYISRDVIGVARFARIAREFAFVFVFANPFLLGFCVWHVFVWVACGACVFV